MPKVVSAEDNLEELGTAAPDLVDAVSCGEYPLVRDQET
jgi:hypothetical protein